MPKSRISRRVALLEERLSVRLLDRSTRRLALTQVGQQVFEHARAAIIEAEAAEDAALRMQAEPRGLVEASASLRCRSALLTESAMGVRRDKAALSSGCEPHPATAPAGSNWSSHGGNEMAEASG